MFKPLSTPLNAKFAINSLHEHLGLMEKKKKRTNVAPKITEVKQTPNETSLKASDSSLAHKHKCINLTGSPLDTFQQMISSQTTAVISVNHTGRHTSPLPFLRTISAEQDAFTLVSKCRSNSPGNLQGGFYSFKNWIEFAKCILRVMKPV